MVQLTVTADYQPYVTRTMGETTSPSASWTAKGYARYTPTTVKKLTDASVDAGLVTLPVDARHAWIFVKDGAVRIRSDATDPTADEGLYLAAGTFIQVENQRQFLQAFRMINANGEVSEVTVMYFS